MPFSEAQKRTVRRRAHLACCLCHNVGVEIHHIVPQAEGGTDDADNAAPLCPSCHEAYGANSTKRKFIREARDVWYDLCDKRYAGDPELLARIEDRLLDAVTRSDLEAAVDRLSTLFAGERDTHVSPRREEEREAELLPPLTEESLGGYLRRLYPTVVRCEPREITEMVQDLRDIGYETLSDLEPLLAQTAEPFADVVQARRDEGYNMDQHTDAFPIQLFLSVFDEEYCRKHFPKVHAKNSGSPGFWLRPARERVGAETGTDAPTATIDLHETGAIGRRPNPPPSDPAVPRFHMIRVTNTGPREATFYGSLVWFSPEKDQSERRAFDGAPIVWSDGVDKDGDHPRDLEVTLRPQKRCDALVVQLSHSATGLNGGAGWQMTSNGLIWTNRGLQLDQNEQGYLVRVSISTDPQFANGPLERWVAVTRRGIQLTDPPGWYAGFDEGSLNWLRDLRHFD